MNTQNTNNKSISYSKVGSLLINEPEILSLQKEVDLYTRKLEQEKRRLLAVEETHSMVKKELKEQEERNRALRKHSKQSDNRQQFSKVKNFENKLDIAIVKYNQLMAYNKKLRHQIDFLRKDRISFQDIYNNMEQKQYDVKQQTQQLEE